MILDAHVHLFSPEIILRRHELVAADRTFAEMYSDPAARMATAEDLLGDMDEDGVDVSVAMGIGWSDPGLARESNDYLSDVVRRHPGRIVGFGTVNPAGPNATKGAASDAANEVERCAALGLRGIGELHPDTQGFDIADPAVMSPILDVLKAHDMALTLHCSEPVGHTYPGKGRTTPDKVMGLVAIAQGVKLLLAHWGGGLPFYALMPEVAEALSDVYFDTAASPFLYDRRVFEVAQNVIKPSRILAASDYPLMRHSRIRKQVERADLSAPDRAAVLGENAARLFGLKLKT